MTDPAAAKNSDTGPTTGASPSRALRIAMLLHGQYPWDERVKREAQALADAGHAVDVICLKQHADEPSREVVDGVETIRLPLRRAFTHGKASYFAEYAASFLGCFWQLTRRHLKARYDLVQVHTLPDFLVFATVVPRLSGCRVVLDMHDLMPELYRSKYGLAEDSRAVRLLRSIERASTRYAHHVITASEAFAERLISTGLPAEKVEVVLNTADPAVFPAPLTSSRVGHPGTLTLFWHGTMVRRYGLDLAIRAVSLVAARGRSVRLVIYGEGECEAELRDLVAELGLGESVEFRGHASHLDLAGHIAEADIGVVPNRPDVHIEMAYPTKLLEFVQMGIPVVATRTKVLASRFGDDAIVFVDASPEDLARGIESIADDPAAARARIARARDALAPVAWAVTSRRYVGLVEAWCGVDARTRRV